MVMRDREVLITGWGHTRFGKLEGNSLESLIVAAGSEAIASAGLDARDIDEVFVGHFNSGMEPLGFVSSLALQISPELRMTPATRVENACASGAAAVHLGIRAIEAGAARNVLVIGAEKMTGIAADVVGAALLGADYDAAGQPSATGFAGLFASVAREYEARYGPVGDALGAIASKNHANGIRNEYAHLRKELTVDFCSTVSESNPIVAGPLRRTDCSPVSDGAAAVVLSSMSVGNAPAVRVASASHANDFMPASKRDPIEFAGSAAAWNQALHAAGISIRDLDLIELHDCFTIAELILYEVMGLAPRGQGGSIAADGSAARDGRLPVNVSGGLKAKGHPVGATGVSQHVMAAMQLTGLAGPMQLPKADRAAVHNMGGLAIANYVTVLEAM